MWMQLSSITQNSGLMIASVSVFNDPHKLFTDHRIAGLDSCPKSPSPMCSRSVITSGSVSPWTLMHVDDPGLLTAQPDLSNAARSDSSLGPVQCDTHSGGKSLALTAYSLLLS
ncbi:hypothetical protein FVEG_03928 [Fusarium verticillioides 7600]|uniref:Uncharacterized protein n=1 Tax=Gibberella moniliformis (strain M3125 / FGSC 7600) TaxID=334819 RepID=W7M363_GIBM7|nr:hypothetical protein FVEG_03928 [Fusarium verticillioides 7600]EWG41949.1 hypothetical protein FVEG_03928 [Fusarium verticillioides 7600]